MQWISGKVVDVGGRIFSIGMFRVQRIRWKVGFDCSGVRYAMKFIWVTSKFLVSSGRICLSSIVNVSDDVQGPLCPVSRCECGSTGCVW